MATKTMLTVEDFLLLPDSIGTQDVRYELVERNLVEIAPEMLQHNMVRDEVLFTLGKFVKSAGLGTVIGLQWFHLFVNTIRKVDVAFLKSGRKLPLDKLPEGPPDLAVEVFSPSNTPRELDQRISDYFAGGCKRVWLVYSEYHEVYIRGLGGVTRRRGDEALEDSELLPGFSVKVSELFA